MLDKILFWVVLVWMIGMLSLAIVAVREVWRDAAGTEPEPEPPDPAPGPEANPGTRNP